MAKRGPKSGFSEKLGSAFTRLAKEGKTMEQIAEVLGVSKSTLIRWMGADQDLRLAVRESRQMADELVEASLYARACGYSHPEQKVFCDKGEIVTHDLVKHYPPDTQAAMFWLRNRQPERWKEKTEGDVNVTQNNHVNAMTDEQLDARIAQYAEKLGKETK